MKNKKFTKGLAFTLLSAGLILTNCTKDKTNTAPTPDTDTKAVNDVVRAQIIASDLGDLVMQACDGNAALLPVQSWTPLTVPMGTTTTAGSIAAIVRDSTNKKFTIYLSNSVTAVPTMGKDGVVKTGTIICNYANTTLPTGNPAKYVRQAGFQVNVPPATTLTIDDYTVTINDLSIFNSTPIGFPITAPYVPSAYNLTFKQYTDITIKHPGTGGNIETISYYGYTNKTILNTNNTAVPMPTPMASQTFTCYPIPYGSGFKQGVAYYSVDGTINGVTSQGDAYVLEIPASTPLKRNMNNSPNAFASIGNVIQMAELHPFVSGTVTVKPGVKTTRSVAFGNPENVDYNTTVNIDGINYSIDFK